MRMFEGAFEYLLDHSIEPHVASSIKLLVSFYASNSSFSSGEIPRCQYEIMFFRLLIVFTSLYDGTDGAKLSEDEVILMTSEIQQLYLSTTENELRERWNAIQTAYQNSHRAWLDYLHKTWMGGEMFGKYLNALYVHSVYTL